jgi:hypothetical protein
LFENRVLRRILAPKTDEVTEGWNKLHNEELRNLHSSPSIIRIIQARRMRWARHVARSVEKNEFRILVGKSTGESPLGRPRSRWEVNSKMDLRETGRSIMDWIGLAQSKVRWRVRGFHKMLRIS